MSTLPADEGDGLRSRRIETDRLGPVHLVEGGPPQARLVLFLHGFPEFWYSWRFQLTALRDAAHVVAVDMRGYNLTARSRRRSDYELPALAADVHAVVHALGYQKAVVVGHDWGGLTAWQYASMYPDATEGVVAMNAPHPLAALRRLRSPEQLLRGLYLVFLQLPWLPEVALAAGRAWPVRQAFLLGAGRREAFPPEVLNRFAEAILRPGALAAALNYPRANTLYLFRNRRNPDRFAIRDDVPALLIWGDQDPFLSRALVDETVAVHPRAQARHVPEAGHWVQQECPDKVNTLLREFLAAAAAPPARRPRG